MSLTVVQRRGEIDLLRALGFTTGRVRLVITHEVDRGCPLPHTRVRPRHQHPHLRVNKAIKRRGRVVGIFPNAAAMIRLVGAVLIDMHDKWIAGDRHYLSEDSMALLDTTMDTGDHAAIQSGE